MSQPFARSIAMFAAIAAAMKLEGPAKHSILQGIGPYKSRGKGRGAPARKFGNKPGWKNYPFSSTRQNERHARTQRMVIVNGFELMQTIPSIERSA